MNEEDSTALETVGLIVPTSLLIIITTILSSYFALNRKQRFFLELFVIVVPSVFVQTIYSDYIAWINSLLILAVICLFIGLKPIKKQIKTKWNKENETIKKDKVDYNKELQNSDKNFDKNLDKTLNKSTVKISDKNLHKNVDENSKLNYTRNTNPGKSIKNVEFVTNIRALTNFLTAIAILAVDFAIFPRRFKKHDEFGFSLMDVGVGLFIYCNGLVAPEIRYKLPPFSSVIKNTIPLFVLGLARFVVTKEIDYKVQVSEYGVHWNFFMTLAVTKVLCSLILTVIPAKYSLMTGVMLLIMHETFLQLGLENYIFADIPREDFISANREGIISCLGYTSLYFMSVTIGQIIDIRDKTKKDWTLFLKLLLLTLFTMAVCYKTNELFGVSRRLTNSGYCIWIIFLGLLMTCIKYAAELCQNNLYARLKLHARFHVPFIFEAINYNGLSYFLVSNLLTGFVNIVFDTMKVPPNGSLVILSIYMFVNISIVVTLYLKNIKLKL